MTEAPRGLHRERLDLRGEPADVLLGLRDRPRLVALVGHWHDGRAVLAWDPLAEAEAPFEFPDRAAGEGSGFGGGWIGAWGYQLGGRLEDLGEPPPRPVPQPAHRLAFYDRVLVGDPDGGWWLEQLTGLVDPAVEVSRREAFRADVSAGAPRPYRLGTFTPTPSDAGHLAAVRRTREAIAAGDLFQANVTMRLEAAWAGDPLDLFVRGLRALRPAYAAFVSDPAGALVGFSPELFWRRRGEEVLTSPIKGTAAVGEDPAALATSIKDRAENVMIVDLMRNDLARVCRPGSVRVPALNRVEQHAVQHLVSDVTGRLLPGVGDGELLRATFPPGSVTGAPKVAAMLLCQEVETTAREAYTGTVGYVGSAAGAELAVTIRTFEVAGDRVWLGVGGGITILSDPAAELEECYLKAGPLLAAVGGSVDRSPVSAPVARSRARRPPAVTTRRTPPREPGRPSVLVVDNYDSFVHNLAHYVEEAGRPAWVVRNDALGVEEIRELRERGLLTHVVISPGPGAPVDAGVSVDLVRELGATTPVLGVCLGHQAIGEALGARVVRARRVVHGRAEPLTHDGRGVLTGLPPGFEVARYHSLALDPATLPDVLLPTSWAGDGELMGVRHRDHPHLEGVQWHPESILTAHGRRVIRRFLGG